MSGMDDDMERQHRGEFSTGLGNNIGSQHGGVGSSPKLCVSSLNLLRQSQAVRSGSSSHPPATSTARTASWPSSPNDEALDSDLTWLVYESGTTQHTGKHGNCPIDSKHQHRPDGTLKFPNKDAMVRAYTRGGEDARPFAKLSDDDNRVLLKEVYGVSSHSDGGSGA